jgi:putative RNA 2'-phosphotransferase
MENLKRQEKFLCLVLRHQPEKIGIKLNEAGWVAIPVLLKALKQYAPDLNFDARMLGNVVSGSEKRRFEYGGHNFIRACQGHSVPVDLGLKPEMPPKVLYHGTVRKYIDSIFETGLEKRSRQFVHLSETIETATQVGGRRGTPVILEVNAEAMVMRDDAYPFYKATNGVWLTDHVPKKFLKILEILLDNSPV